MSTPAGIYNININTSTTNDTVLPLTGNPLSLQILTPFIIGEDKNVVVSLKSFNSTNTFDNISASTKTNRLKLVTIYQESPSSPNQNVVFNDITVPDGHYSVTTLLNYLNGNSSSNVLIGSYDATTSQWYDKNGNTSGSQQASYFTYSTIGNPYTGSANTDSMYFCYQYFGLSFNGLSNTPTYPIGTPDTTQNSPTLGFVTNTDGSRVILNPPTPSSVYYKNWWNSTANTSTLNNIQITGLYLIFDDETKNLMDILGFLNTDCTTYNGQNFPNVISPGDQVIGWNITNQYLITESSSFYYYYQPSFTLKPITGSKTLYLGTPSTLNMTIQEMTLKNFGNILETDRYNIISTIPVSTAFGSVISFYPANPTRHFISGPLTISQLTFTFYDEDFDIPNFEGIAWQAQIELAVYLKPQVQAEEYEGKGSADLPRDILRTQAANETRKRPNPFSFHASSPVLSNTVHAPNNIVPRPYPTRRGLL